MNTSSIHRPRPSIDARTPASVTIAVKRGLVNRLPWSVLKNSGRPRRASASSSASRQNSTSSAFDGRQAETFRPAQSRARRG